MTPEEQRLEMMAAADKCRGWVIGKVGWDADDVLQDSILRGFEAIKARGETMENPAGYFVKILQSQIGNLYRRRMRRKLHIEIGLLMAELRDETKNPEQILSECEDDELVSGWLSNLAPRRREVFERLLVRGESAGQIKAEMGLSDNSYKLLKINGKKKLIEMQRAESDRARSKNAAPKAA